MKYRPRRPSPRYTWSVCTPCRRSSLITAVPSAESGTILTMEAVCPRRASETATLASAPPMCTCSAGDCRSSSRPGAFRRSSISPKHTTPAPIVVSSSLHLLPCAKHLVCFRRGLLISLLPVSLRRSTNRRDGTGRHTHQPERAGFRRRPGRHESPQEASEFARATRLETHGDAPARKALTGAAGGRFATGVMRGRAGFVRVESYGLSAALRGVETVKGARWAGNVLGAAGCEPPRWQVWRYWHVARAKVRWGSRLLQRARRRGPGRRRRSRKSW